MLRMNVIWDLESHSKLKLLEANRVTTDINPTDMKYVLQFSDQAQHFTGTFKVDIKEQIAYNSKSTFRKPGKVSKTYNDKESECRKTANGYSHGDKSCPTTVKKK